MARKWSGRLLALGALALALGCRTYPGVPVCTTPLLPDTAAPGPFVSSNKPAIPPTGALSKSGADVAKAAVPDLNIQPPVRTDLPPILPPKDVAKVIPAVPAPAIKPLLVDAPKPKPGEDGFAPGPRVPAPTPEPVIVPVAVHRPQAPATPLPPGQRIGHAPDYRWVVGVADRHVRGGYWTVRFADIGDDDRWGGKVRLLDDDRLRDLSNGAVIYVTGQVLAPASSADSAPAYPPYRVTSVTIVEKAR
jgi:hypothetical protein